MDKRVYGYIRVSSKEQNIDRQVKDLIAQGVEEQYIFIDKVSGKDFNREQYQILKHALREGDVLVIKSIDRLGRNYKMIIDEWRELTYELQVDIKVVDMPLLDTTKNKDLLGTFISDLVLQVLSYVAEQERTFIKQRQREGIKVAKDKGIKFGRPEVNKPNNFDDVVQKWRQKEINAKDAMCILGLKPNTFYKMIKS